jgi:glycosyltransferase involved in cell wall biosynthesis
LLQGLAQQPTAPELHLLAFQQETVEVEENPLTGYCKTIYTVPAPSRSATQRLQTLGLSNQPDLARRLESEAMRRQLTKILQEIPFDIIQYEGLEMAIYLQQAQSLQPQAKHIYDAHNAEFALQSRIAQVETRTLKRLPAAFYSREQTRRLTAFEREICTRADAVIAVSQEDAAVLHEFRADKHVSVVPNGITVADYVSNSQPLDLAEDALVFTGKMDYRPNIDAMVWFNNDIFPQILERTAQAKLYIVGQKPHASLADLSASPQIELTGWVPSVLPYLHGAKVYIAPLRMGAGTRLKLLEAMAAGCAIVATPTAASGLSAKALKTMIMAENAADFAQACLRLLANPDERATLGAAAKVAVTTSYDWSILIPCLMQIYQSVARG